MQQTLASLLCYCIPLRCDPPEHFLPSFSSLCDVPLIPGRKSDTMRRCPFSRSGDECEGPEPYTPRTQTTHYLKQVRQGTPETIKLPYRQNIPRPEKLQAYLRTWPVVTGSRCFILMDVSFIDPGTQQCVPL
jgi:hypothetical protein